MKQLNGVQADNCNKQKVWVKREDLKKGEVVLDMKGKPARPDQSVSSVRAKSGIDPWVGRHVTEDGDRYPGAEAAPGLYSMALVEREIKPVPETAKDILARVGVAGIQAAVAASVNQAQAQHHKICTPQSAYETLARKTAGGLTGVRCLERYSLNMREGLSNGVAFARFKLTPEQKSLGSQMWAAKLKEKQEVQQIEDASKEISVLCENQYADGDEW